jgi:hypothetical protein
MQLPDYQRSLSESEKRRRKKKKIRWVGKIAGACRVGVYGVRAGDGMGLDSQFAA